MILIVTLQNVNNAFENLYFYTLLPFSYFEKCYDFINAKLENAGMTREGVTQIHQQRFQSLEKMQLPVTEL